MFISLALLAQSIIEIDCFTTKICMRANCRVEDPLTYESDPYSSFCILPYILSQFLTT